MRFRLQKIILLAVGFTMVLSNNGFGQPSNYTSKELTLFDPEMNDYYRLMQVHRQEGGHQKYLLTLILFREFHDGHSRQFEVGSYQWEDSILTLWSYWNFKGQDNVAPFGARHMLYCIGDDGKLHLIKGEIYLEEGDRSQGAAYLHDKDLTPQELATFQAYVQHVQKEYKARFVFGAESMQLIQDARDHLQIQIVLAEAKKSR